ncbi:MAG: hypothetical protein ACJ0FP_02215 [Gammaproteobacteria bacterium]
MQKDVHEKDFQSFKDSLNTRQCSLCYIDSVSHFKNVQQIQEKSETEILFLINKKALIRELNNASSKYFFFKNKLSLLGILFKIRNQRFNCYIAACVDQASFQLIYFLSRFSFFVSIDEGVFSVDKSSRFNSEKNFNFTTHRLYFYLEKIFKYPKVPRFFLKAAKYHFGWFEKSLYDNTIIGSKLILMKPNIEKKSDDLRVFIGQPFKWMNLSAKDLNNIRNLIKSEKIDIYIKHPRETMQNSILSDVSCPIISMDTNAESFLNIISNENISVYSFMSSVIFGINPKLNIKILSLPLQDDLKGRHDSFLLMLQKSGIKYTLIQYV